MKRAFLALVLAATVLGTNVVPVRAETPEGSVSHDAVWQALDAKGLDGVTPNVKVRPGFASVYFLNERALSSVLSAAPLEFTEHAKQADVQLTLPMPDGTFERFRVVESPVMEPALAAEYPEIKTYVAQGVDDPTATARIDRTPLGFHAQVLAAGRTVYVDPYAAGDVTRYISYDKRGLRLGGRAFECLVDDALGTIDPQLEDAEKTGVSAAYSNGGTLRTYRLAQACTGEYATAICNHNGVSVTVANVMSAITTTINRVTGVYEREVSIRLVLVGNNSTLVFTDAASDPYTNTNANSLLTQNQSTCDSRIGSANYDIGHVFSTGGGGLAGLGVVCSSTRKAQGETGSSAPWGDGFDIDYVAHEMGHQFGGNHTFVGTQGSCSGNGNASTAYERGSGSTIQAYAGICGTEDLQPHSDDYFHTISLNEITAYVAGGGNCSTNTSTGNTIPALPALTSYTGVPVSTPFTLTAPAATDANGDTLTYCWEDWQTGSGALFRPKAPTTSPSRTFSNVANPTSGNLAWEVLPTTARTMTFRCTVRDNRAGGGAFTSSTMTVAFVAGAHQVTAPNTAVSWAGNSTQTVTWNKGGGTAANVAIQLSTNGGSTWTTVVGSTANDGSEAITVPNTPSTTCRVRVAAVGSIYFDDSDTNFTITSGGTPTPDFALSASPASVSVAQGASGTSTVTSTVSGGFNAAVSLSATGLPSGATASFSPASLAAPGSGSSTLTLAAGAATPAGTYTVTVTGSGGSLTRTTSVSLTVTTTGGGCSSSTTAITAGTPASGSLATTDCTVTAGNGSAGGYYDRFTFSATAGTQYTIVMTSTAFDTYLRLKDSGGTQVAFDDDGNGGTNSKIVYTPTASGTYTIESTSYSPGSTGAYTVSLTGGTTGGTELVTNGGFESGTTGWTFATYSSVTSGSPQAGTYKAQQLGRGTTTTTNFYQPISGFNGTSKTLRFYLKMSSSEGTSTAYDYLRVRIYNTTGGLVSTLGTYSNVNKNTYAGWTLVTLTIPSSAAANYRLQFDASEDSSLATTFYVDGVSIQ